MGSNTSTPLIGLEAGSKALAKPGAALRRLVWNRRTLRVALHLALIPCTYLAAFTLRFDFTVPDEFRSVIAVTLPILIATRMAAFFAFGVFDGWWRRVGMFDLLQLIKAVTVGSAAFLAAVFFARQLAALPRSILLVEWGVAILVFSGLRIGVRWLRERSEAESPKAKRALVVGAGETAATLIRQVRIEPEMAIRVVGLVDDDRSKRRLQIHGVQVLGTTADLPALVAEHEVQAVIVALPSATREDMHRIVDRCTGLPVELKVVPRISELLDGSARLSQLRAVKTEELLGRAPVSLEVSRVQRSIQGKTVLITGGAGSIGLELARQVSSFRPRRLLLLDRAENDLYFGELALRRAFPEVSIVSLIGDITDPERLETIFTEHSPDYVFHAAAYKHVPLMESHVREAIRNNIFGTLHTARAAAAHRVERFVFISTDKAVKPSSVMGATKRVAERVVLELEALCQSATDFRAVRFGNVLGSAGSVVPLFRRQIAAGGPVTVTDRDVTRYFMTIPEAVQLVLRSTALPDAAGRIAMLDMGKPVRVLELAENMIRLSGLEPYTQIPIVFTGLRPGEKLHEELTADAETSAPTTVDRIRIVHGGGEDDAVVREGLDRLAAALELGGTDEQLAALCALVPERVPPLRTRGEEAFEQLAPTTSHWGPRAIVGWQG